MLLHEHPRLHVSLAMREGLADPVGDSPLLRRASDTVRRDADAFLREGPVFPFPERSHNAHLIRARIMQGRVVTLLTRWTQMGETRYRSAALAHIRQMSLWRYWSWILWRERDRNPAGVFDLSYGENSATLALAWDWLYPTLSPKEKRMMIAMARRWPLAAFLEQEKQKLNWWRGKKDSNWNTVCAGGLGMLMLAMREALPESDAVLKKVEASFRPFMRHLDAMGGGWPEGIGYWGYGMRYAFMYLLSWENATGRVHPLLRLPGVRRTVAFPLDFSPRNVPCSFGDANSFSVQPFQYLMAERFRRPDIVAMIADRQQTQRPTLSVKKNGNGWPQAAETLLFFPRRRLPEPQTRAPYVRRYGGMDWMCMADQWPNPKLYMSIRGGTTEVPHGHADLTSFHLTVDDESMIVNLTPSEYLDSTFSPRRYAVFEMTPPSKNVLMINGVGPARPASVTVRRCRTWGIPAIRIDATAATGQSRNGQPVAVSYMRLFAMIDAEAMLIADRVVLPHYGRFETRFHTLGKPRVKGDGVLIRGRRQWLRVAFAADQPAHARASNVALTSPAVSEPSLLRWRTDDLHREITLAALFVPGKAPATLSVRRDKKALLWEAGWGGRTLSMKSDLRLSRLENVGRNCM